MLHVKSFIGYLNKIDLTSTYSTPRISLKPSKTKAVYIQMISTCILHYDYKGMGNILFSLIYLIVPFCTIILMNLGIFTTNV